MPKTRDEQTRRRKEILNILNGHDRIESLDDLLLQLETRRIEASKSSVSRDLKDLAIIRVNGR
ncbi:MAG: Arginine repressor, binding domain, partial [Acidobacteriota bacterium]|nr:Arginine repressor, binding domain [Acidobacteriota bacterium]